MRGFLDELELELIDAVERNARMATEPAKRSGLSRLRRISSLRAFALAMPLVLLLTAVALAATGVIFDGAPVAPTPHLARRVGVGIPAPGRSRLIARSVPDPAGGLPWSMRIVHTSRGVVCMQVGRLHDGEVGVIGEDGAFRDDGLFHRLSTRDLDSSPGSEALRLVVSCHPEGETSEEVVSGLPESAELLSTGTLGRPSEERRLYFGLLGPHAVSITYRVDGHAKTMPVEPGSGAYLIVLRGVKPARPASESGGIFGYPTSKGARIRADAPLTSITYRLGDAAKGDTCVEAGLHPATSNACPRESLREREREQQAERKRALDDLHENIDVKLKPMPADWYASEKTKSGKPPQAPRGAVKGVYYAASISFKAPVTVANASSGYTLGVQSPNCSARRGGSTGHALRGSGGGTVVSFGSTLERDVSAGAIVRVSEPNVFANDLCGRPVKIEIFYHDIAKGDGELVGERSVAEP